MIAAACTDGLATDAAKDRYEATPVPAASDSERPVSTSTPTAASASVEGTSVTVDWVLDGDSFEATGPGGPLEIRLLGVNANEQTECLGNAARDRLIELIAREEVVVQIDGFDEFGRELAYVFHEGTLVNVLLIDEGLAVARSVFGHEREAEFDASEARARNAQIGLWAPDACGPPDTSGVVIADVKYDADGPDNENPNGEWILLENTSAVEVALDGWTVRDESTRHRYVFADATAIPPGGQLRLRSGCGTDTTNELYWCNNNGTVWSNSGDTAFVLNVDGVTVDQVSWESIYDE